MRQGAGDEWEQVQEQREEGMQGHEGVTLLQSSAVRGGTTPRKERNNKQGDMRGHRVREIYNRESAKTDNGNDHVLFHPCSIFLLSLALPLS